MRLSRRPLLVACAAAVLGPSAVSAAPAPPVLVRLAGTVPSWATPANRLGPAAPEAELEAHLLLPWRDPAAVRRLVARVSDPASPDYGHHLTPAQFRERFAPAESTVATVAVWARANHLRPGRVPANRAFVPVRGTVAAVERAFATTLGRYVVQGQVLRAPDRAPALPARIADLVSGVRGLDESSALIRPGAFETVPDPGVEEPATPADTTPPTAVVYANPCSAYDGEKVAKTLPKVFGKRQPYVSCGTTPAQLRAAYGVPRSLTGSGQTIVMTGSHAIRQLRGDVAEWSRRRGLPALRAGQLRQVSYPGAYQTPVVPAPANGYLRPEVWAVQASTLFEHMRAVAPAADLVYVGSTTSLDISVATLVAVDQELGDVVVNGWYTLSEDVPDPEVTLITKIAEQAAATGITLLFASGDLGDGTYSGNSSPSPAYPANHPDVTAVGATSLLLGKGGAYKRELAWGKLTYTLVDGDWEEDDQATYRGSGGGVSNVHDQPAYQRGVVPDAVAERLTSVGKGRALPDVAVAGDAETGLVVGYTQRFPNGTDRYSERRVASDTAATAVWGAFVALLNQKSGARHGFLNPLLYSTWKSRRSAYRDIVPSGQRHGRVRMDYANNTSGELKPKFKQFEEFTSTVPLRGFDTATGLGTPSPSFWSAVR